MARLPSGEFLVQQIGDDVVVFEGYTERQIARFNPTNAESMLDGIRAISVSELSSDDKAMAQFWSGYFYAHAVAGLPDSYFAYSNKGSECPLCLVMGVHIHKDGYYSLHVNPAGVECQINQVISFHKTKIRDNHHE